MTLARPPFEPLCLPIESGQLDRLIAPPAAGRHFSTFSHFQFDAQMDSKTRQQVFLLATIWPRTERRLESSSSSQLSSFIFVLSPTRTHIYSSRPPDDNIVIPLTRWPRRFWWPQSQPPTLSEAKVIGQLERLTKHTHTDEPRPIVPRTRPSELAEKIHLKCALRPRQLVGNFESKMRRRGS